MTNSMFTGLIAAVLGLTGFATLAQHQEHDAAASPFQIPAALKAEHDALHGELVDLLELPGRTGEAAKRVADALHEHFVSEEEFALPPLGLLEPLARGELKPGMRGVLEMTERLKSDLPRMLEEHQAIVAALEQLEAAAKAEDQPKAVEFAAALKLHAQNEEQVLSPAALLVGEYVKLKLAE
jgi:hypothetical protein